MINPSAVLRSCAQTLQESLGPVRGVPGAALMHSHLGLLWLIVTLLIRLQENSLLLASRNGNLGNALFGLCKTFRNTQVHYAGNESIIFPRDWMLEIGSTTSITCV